MAPRSPASPAATWLTHEGEQRKLKDILEIKGDFLVARAHSRMSLGDGSSRD
jgi:hypothetical protein